MSAEQARIEWAKVRQEEWAQVLIGPPEDVFERAAAKAIEADPRIKVIGLSIRELNAHDMKVTGFHMAKYGDCLLFRFQCPCGDVRTEIMALGEDWVPRFPQLLEDLSKGTFEHLRSEGFVV